jgi:hypothetical protein
LGIFDDGLQKTDKKAKKKTRTKEEKALTGSGSKSDDDLVPVFVEFANCRVARSLCFVVWRILWS